MSTERKGQWVECTYEQYADAVVAAARWSERAGGFEHFIPAPDERDAEIAKLNAKLAKADQAVREHGERTAQLRAETEYHFQNVKLWKEQAETHKYKASLYDKSVPLIRAAMAYDKLPDDRASNDLLNAVAAWMSNPPMPSSVEVSLSAAEIARLKSELAEAKKPVSVPGRPFYLGNTFLHAIDIKENTGMHKAVESIRLYALALESRVRELEAEKAAKPLEYTDEHLDTIARVTERATRIYTARVMSDDDAECRTAPGVWREVYLVALDGEPAHAEMVAKIKAGGA